MNQCLRITVSGDCGNGFLKNVIQKNARKYELEGVAKRVDEEHAKIMICGSSDNVENFIDLLHLKDNIEGIEIEPFLKERDYRRIFRVVE